MPRGKHESFMRRLILFLLFCSVVSAWNKHPNDTTPQNNTAAAFTNADGRWDYPYGERYKTDPHIGFLCALMIFIGVYLMVAAFRLFTITMGVIGFLLGSIVCWVLLTVAEPLPDGYYRASIVYSFGSYGAGLVVAGACIYFWNVTIYFIGVLAGYVFAVFIWSWRSDLIIQNVYARQFASVGFSVVAVVAILIAEYVSICILTSFLGAYFFILGLDMAVRTSMLNGVRAQLDATHHVHYTANNHVYAMLGGVLGLWLISMIFQLLFNRGRRFGLELIVKDEEEEKPAT
ncbi:hypothetical protein BJV82DRAFT_370378 [Fennellomyces sp. T-0311]|nr:hypothetical protein BJV82DRAFT_370378 [Fennellomyces sp. T-0311]